MTDKKQSEIFVSIHTSDEARLRLKKRYQQEARFKFLGQAAIFFSVGFLVLLLSTITIKGLPAFTHNFISLNLDVSELQGLDEAELNKYDYDNIVKNAIRAEFPDVKKRRAKRALLGLISSGAPVILREQVLKNPSKIASEKYKLPMSDFADLYLKGFITKDIWQNETEEAQVEVKKNAVTLISATPKFNDIISSITERLTLEAQKIREQEAGATRSKEKIIADIKIAEEKLLGANEADIIRLIGEIEKLNLSLEKAQKQIEKFAKKAMIIEAQADLTPIEGGKLTKNDISVFLYINDAVIKAEKITPNSISGEMLLTSKRAMPTNINEWRIRILQTPQANRKFSDQEIIWSDELSSRGYIAKSFNTIFATRGASREPEMAGIWGAVVGSFLTLVVTLALAFPLGVAAAIYLEEFAPKNRWTTIIEVNINNLAAVPSIVFGLLGLAVFLNFFGLNRSAPYVGGMVLALMTLPTIIIASRAALRAVPPSIREAALGIGASKLQTVLHHVLPLAMPGIMTGTIIGMAQSLGETAPLLMIGMVAFVVDIPGGFSDPATVLPVQIFMWADFPEPAFEQRTSAAILVLLGFLILMNALAVILRKKFERRW